MGLSIDGLSSGLDTTSLINSLMTIEAAPQTLLKSRAAAVQSRISALQGLNSALADLATKATKLTQPKALDLYSATSSSAKVTTSVGAGASAGSLDFTVSKLAKPQVSVTQKMLTWPYTTVTITSGGGEPVTVTPATSSMDDVVTALNAAGAGVTASKVAVGGGEFRLQFTSTATGAAAAFTIDDPDGTVGLADITVAQDAEVKLWAGTAAEQNITSATNKFEGLLTGVSLTVSEVSETPVRVTVAKDNAQITKAASDLMSSVSGVLAQISTKSTVVASTNASGAAVTSGGIFTGDSTVRGVNASIISAVSQPIDGKSPAEFGIKITKTGTFEFDATKFGEALAKDPTATMAAVTTIAGRVADAAKQASDPATGLISSKIIGQQSTAKDFTAQIESWDDRLALRRTTLQRTYSGLEVALSGMKAQSAWLSAQLAGLSGSSQS
ncbi:flagellar filament capping protein FliD [Arthrobacter sp. PAMC25284]|uniref:flagellar filament capping protein FliD n=1 Tax=Arthrobacter sp. PAMC25284 TaxID=2861279 RepID=UPI001C62DD65|nr:flagellar filament capping protein FliD [Arthrobacter sp. PAMC25284]QYF91269.1 flagellar filament capping protein FliD [Arthrobacter sp. PAMC25284]